jgi:hypothetical protein
VPASARAKAAGDKLADSASTLRLAGKRGKERRRV